MYTAILGKCHTKKCEPLQPSRTLRACHQAFSRKNKVNNFSLLTNLFTCGVCRKQMKNCDPFEFLPEFAIESMPSPLCFSLKFSSLNFPSNNRGYESTIFGDPTPTVNRFPARPIPSCEISSLCHETRHNSMEFAVLVTETCKAKSVRSGVP